jgi:hypothetical protein
MANWTDLTYDEFLLTIKKINPLAFAAGRPAEYAEYGRQFVLIGPVSFDQQAKFFFNEWRRLFPGLGLPPSTHSGALPAPLGRL